MNKTVYVLKQGPGGEGADLFATAQAARDYAIDINLNYDPFPMIFLDPTERDGLFFQRAEDLRGITRFYIYEQIVHEGEEDG